MAVPRPLLVFLCPRCARVFAHSSFFTTVGKVIPAPFQLLYSAPSSSFPVLLILRTLSPSVNKKFLKSVLRADVGKSAGQCGLFHGQFVHVFVPVSGEAVFARTATLNIAGTSGKISLCLMVYNLKLLCTEESGQVVISAPKIQEQCKTPPYLYRFITCEKVLKSMDEFYTSSFYVWH